MRNEPKSRAGKYDHVKPLPYKRFHPEVLKVICALLFSGGYTSRKLDNGANGLGHINHLLHNGSHQYCAAGASVYRTDVLYPVTTIGLLQLGYNWRVFKRLGEYVKTGDGYVRASEMYPLIEEDLRDLGVLGRKRQ